MKVVVLHPPLYPVNHKFFNELGKHLDLVVFSFGNQPGLYNEWKVESFIHSSNNYKLKIIDGKTNLKRFAVSYRTQLNPTFLFKVKKEKPDIVISVAFWFPSLYMTFFKRIFNCKLVVLTDAIKQTEQNNSLLRNLIRTVIAKNTDTFIGSSDLTVSYLKQKFSNVEVKKSFQTIDVEDWQIQMSKLESKEILKKELKLPLNKSVLLTVGNLIARKNHKKLITQSCLIKDSYLIIIGEGELKGELEKQIQINNLKDKVVLVSRKEGQELKKYFKAADVFVFPSIQDQFGYVVVEALASGLPVICSKGTGASSIIENNKNGFVFHPQEDFTDYIKYTINNLNDMSPNALDSVSKYTIENKAEAFYKTLTNID